MFATDPCDAAEIGNGPAPATRAANCAAAGVPPNFQALSNQRSFLGYVVGNPNLENEKADSFTAGIVFSPRFIPRLTITADYVNIRLRGAIIQFATDDVLNACYDSMNFATNPFCALVTRDAQRQISSVTTSYFNSTVLRYCGIIGNLDYRIDTPFLGAGTRIGINVSYQHLLELSNLTGGAAAPRIVATSLGYSRDRAVATVSYDGGPLALQAQFNSIGPANLDPNAAANFYSIPRVGSVVFTNLSASLTVDRRFTFRANVDNLFDVNPPYPALLAGGGLQPHFSGVLGRYYRIGVEVGF